MASNMLNLLCSGNLADSAALVLSNLKKASSSNYNSLLKYVFDPTDGANSAGLSYIRIPLGSSDLSASAYSYDDTSGDTSLSKFSIDVTPSYVFSTLNDIKAINNRLKLHFVPWSPVRTLTEYSRSTHTDTDSI
jgi:O-glycosyl hydrolase